MGLNPSSVTDTTKFSWFLVLLFILGLVLALIPWQQSLELAFSKESSQHVANILVKIGEALIIAPVLAFAVDRAAKLQLLKEFGENISLHIMGRFLPQDLRDHLESYLGAKFVRRNWDITYTIAELPENTESVKLTTRSEYEIENCSNESAVYTFSYKLDQPWGASNSSSGQIVRVATFDPNTNNEFKYIEGEELKKIIKPLPGGQLFSQEITIEPVADSSHIHRSYKFATESNEVFPKSYREHFTAKYPVLNTTLTVYYPMERVDVEVELSFAGAEALESTPMEQGRRWLIKKPMLPGQCFFTTWKPKVAAKEKSSTTTEQPSEAVKNPLDSRPAPAATP